MTHKKVLATYEWFLSSLMLLSVTGTRGTLHAAVLTATACVVGANQ